MCKLCLKRRNLHVYWEQKTELVVQGESAAPIRLSKAEGDMDIGNWEQRNADIALCEFNRELESQRLELYQANQWQVRLKEKRSICVGNLK